MKSLFGRTRLDPEPERPDLLQRAFAAGCSRLAVLSLHPGAGSRTVVESVVAEFHRNGIVTGITRVPRVVLEVDDIQDQVSRMSLPEGTMVATTAQLIHDPTLLECLHDPGCATALGDLFLYRLTRAGEVSVYGPEDPAVMRTVLDHLQARSGGLVLTDGAWERRSFAAPDVTQGVILVVGCGFSGSAERSAAAVAYVAETLRVPACSDRFRSGWREASELGSPLALDRDGRAIAPLASDKHDPAGRLSEIGDEVEAVVLPDGLHDEFIGPLTRGTFRCALIVKDPTRIHAAPVYYRAWVGKGGAVQVVEPLSLLAIATNPVNATGPDADPDAFRRCVTEAVPGIAVHDVRLESVAGARGGRWKFW